MMADVEGALPSGQYWQAWTADVVQGVVVLVHGVHEHGGRYRHVGERLAAAGYAVYAVDHPGHGRSDGARGNLGRLAAAVEGVDLLARLAAERHPAVPLFVYGHSMGGLIALQYLTGAHHERIRGGVLSAPALDLSAASGLQRLIAPALSRLLPNAGALALDLDAISRDPQVVADYRADPLNRIAKVVARTGTEMMLAVTAMPRRLASLTMPLLVVHGSADRLVPVEAIRMIANCAASPDLTLKVYDGLYHEPHNEPEKEQVLGDIVDWLDAHRS